MKRFATLIFIFFALATQLSAQVDYSFGNIKRKPNKTNAPYVGLKAGYSLYNMRFSNKNYDKLPGEYLMKPVLGVYFECPIDKIKGLSVGCEAIIIERGMKKSFYFRDLVRENDVIDAKYFDFRIPVSYRFCRSRVVNPYVFAAADFAFCYGGTVSTEFPDGELTGASIDISKSDAVMSIFDASIVAGAGLRFNIGFRLFTLVIKADAAYNFGLINTMSSTDGTPVNVYAWTFNDKQTRFNRGLEFMLSIGIPLRFNRGRDACWGWDK